MVSLSDWNLMLQLVLVVAMLLGVRIVKKGGFRGHGRIMGLSVIFTFISLLIVMGPSLIRGFGALVSKPSRALGRVVELYFRNMNAILFDRLNL